MTSEKKKKKTFKILESNKRNQFHLKMSAQAGASLDKYGDDDLFSTLLRYGLFLGAIFQLLCILSSILLPGCDFDASSSDVEDLKHGTGDAFSNVRRLHKLRKQEKKKRR